MAVLAHLEPLRDSADRRLAKRRELNLQAQSVLGRESATVLVHDISESGMLLQPSETLPVGTSLAVALPEAGEVSAKVVWSTGQFVGCEFDSVLPKAVVSAALLRSSAPSRSEADCAIESSQNDRSLGRTLWVIIGLSTLAWVVVLGAAAAIL